MTARFIPATPTDLNALLPLVEAFYQYDGHPFDAARAETTLRQLINNPSFGRVWLIVVDENIVGYLIVTYGFSLEYYGRDAFIDEVFIVEAFRGQGLGSQTFAFAEQHCRDEGVTALHLEVETHNTSAQAFYDKQGYTSHHRLLLNKWL